VPDESTRLKTAEQDGLQCPYCGRPIPRHALVADSPIGIVHRVCGHELTLAEQASNLFTLAKEAEHLRRRLDAANIPEVF
jgi:hypothetical protein